MTKMKSERITEVDEQSQSINVKYKSQKNSRQKTILLSVTKKVRKEVPQPSPIF